MNLATAYTLPEQPFMRVVKDETRVFQTRYLKGLNLATVRGWSVTKDAQSKYDQLLTDIETHLETENSLNIHFKYELFNSSTVKYLFKIIKILNKAYTNGKVVKIYWSCASRNDGDMIDTGLDLAKMSDFKFQISYL